MPELSKFDDVELREYFKPRDSGFRAEIYLPDNELLVEGYKPTIAFKGSSGPIKLADAKTRDTTLEDFAGINGPQTIGLRTDYYDRAMRLASDFQKFGADVDYTGHSLGGGLASAAVSVSGERAVTFNAAPLHPNTAQDYKARFPSVEIHDPNERITAYQVQGELLSDGVMHNIDRLDAFHNRQLAEVMRHSATILLNVPDEAREELKERIGRMMPAHARESFGAFVDRLAEGDTEALLRDMPLAPGRVVPMRAMTRRDPDDPDSPIVPRADIPSLSGVSDFAGPLLQLAHREAQAARVGNEIGEWVEAGARHSAKSLDDTGDVVRGLAASAGDLQGDLSRTAGRAVATGVRNSGEASADIREIAGKVEATVDVWQGEMQARNASAGAAVLRRIGDIDLLPDGVQRWANREAEELRQSAQAAREHNRVEAVDALRDAAQDARQIRENAAVVASTLDNVTVIGSRNQRDAIVYAGKSVDQVLDIAGDRLADASGYAPAAGAVAFAGLSLNVNTMAAHNTGTDIAQSATFGTLAVPAGWESFQRHVNGTVVPSVETRLEAFEEGLRAKYPALSAPKNARERDDGRDDDRAPDAPPREGRAQPTMTDAAHPAHAMFLQAGSAMRALETAPGMGLTQHERTTLGASLVAEALSAQNWRFTAVDHVVPGLRTDPATGRPDTVFVVQGALDDPAHRRIAVNVEQALSQSIERSSAVAQTVQQTREETLAQEQTRAEALDMDGPRGPVMRMGARTLQQPRDEGAGGGDGG